MKKSVLTITIAIAFFFTSSVILSSCGEEQKHKIEDHEHAEGMEHDEDMQQHKHEAANQDSVKHEEMNHGDHEELTHACPMHPEVKGKEGDHCSKCDMSLEVISIK